MKKIVTIGGGTGSFTVLSGLKKYSDLDLTAIVAMSDDGGSTGILRDELGVLPPGDVRQCLVALSESPEIMRDLFNYRFDNGGLKGHNFGNLFISALEKITGNFSQAVETSSEVLKIKGKVIPVTTQNIKLHTKLKNGKTLEGECKLSDFTDLQTIGYEKMFLIPEANINPDAQKAILEADLIVIGPGNFYSSLVPNLLVKGVPEALQNTKAKVVYNCNLMIKYGQTEGFEVHDFVEEIQKILLPNTIDIVLYNTASPDPKLIANYKEEGLPVVFDKKRECEGNIQFIGKDLLAERIYTNLAKKDLLRRTLIRHDSDKIAKAIYETL
jgi:uncharacterized cofD-like protein